MTNFNSKLSIKNISLRASKPISPMKPNSAKFMRKKRVKHQRKFRILGSFNNHGWSFTGRLLKPAFAGAKQQKTRPRGKKWLLLFGRVVCGSHGAKRVAAGSINCVDKFKVSRPCARELCLLAWRAWKEKSRKIFSANIFHLSLAQEKKDFQFCEKKERGRVVVVRC